MRVSIRFAVLRLRASFIVAGSAVGIELCAAVAARFLVSERGWHRLASDRPVPSWSDRTFGFEVSHGCKSSTVASEVRGALIRGMICSVPSRSEFKSISPLDPILAIFFIVRRC